MVWTTMDYQEFLVWWGENYRGTILMNNNNVPSVINYSRLEISCTGRSDFVGTIDVRDQ